MTVIDETVMDIQGMVDDLNQIVKGVEARGEELLIEVQELKSDIRELPAKVKKPKGMIFVDVKIRGITMSTLVDIETSNLFISQEATKKLDLSVEKGRASWLKTVNSSKVLTSTMARDVELHLGPLTSKENIEMLKGAKKGDVTFLTTLKVEDAKGGYAPKELGEAQWFTKWFTKLNLRLGYYQVQITKGDGSKIACVMHYESYEFRVMPFGLTNTPTTLCTLMNKELHLLPNWFVVVYLDDIFVYGRTLEEHIERLRMGPGCL
ncbi:uncharacterized protein LOC120292614 [Eucalyptus grandis]|uniref:uncharacterized protein LOC120292614 n=1 Tax=Eucalyptus grandis TaxID=71139 RepID=UPI00192E989C|nr:uncharacterized protein LOC120292614 [Eucalyptus grandis]